MGNNIKRDPLFYEAGELILEKRKTTLGFIQVNFKIGFNRAVLVMQQLEEAGVIGPEKYVKEREILMSPEQFREKYSEK